ncbi:MAG: acyltransferase [Candidatus Dormibacteria bacterium]
MEVAPAVAAGAVPRADSRRLISADALRALATVWVIVIHTVHWVNGDLYIGLDLIARWSVPAFVVLTGVLLSYRYGAGPIDTVAFLRRRFARTLIPFAVWAPVYVVWGWNVSHDPSPQGGWASVWVFLYWGAGHLWFLLLIPQLYLLYLVWPRRRLALAASTALAVQVGLAFAHLELTLTGGVPNSLLQQHAFQLVPFWVGYFGAGVLAGRTLAARGEPQHVHRRLLTAAIAAILLGGYLQVQHFAGVASDLQSGTGAFVLPQEPLLVLGIAALVLLTARPLLATRRRATAATSFVADNSLGIYIIHPIVVYGIGKWIFDALLAQPLPTSFVGFLVLTAGGLAGSALVARLISATPLAPAVGTPRRPLRGRPRRSPAAAAA